MTRLEWLFVMLAIGWGLLWWWQRGLGCGVAVGAVMLSLLALGRVSGRRAAARYSD